MAQYDTLNVKLSNRQLNKLKSEIKNQTETTLNLSSNLIWNCNDKTNFPHELLITNTQVPKIRKAFANGSPDDTVRRNCYLWLSHFRKYRACS